MRALAVALLAAALPDGERVPERFMSETRCEGDRTGVMERYIYITLPLTLHDRTWTGLV
jgi:hypothetical protein